MLLKLFALLIGHAFADMAFQSEAMARGKNWHNKGTPPPGQKYQSTWPYWLTAHALVHGGVVWMITGNVYLGLAETFTHWVIDFGKCSNWYGIHQDQAMHVGLKLIWSLI